MSAATCITPSFLRRMQGIYPPSSSGKVWKNPWYILASVAFSAANEPEGVPIVFQYALQGVEGKDRMTLARKTRDAIFKSGLTSGYSKAINSLVALDAVMPEELKERQVLRDTSKSIAAHAASGKAFFEELYGDTAIEVQGLLDRVYPDLGWFSNAIGYGLTYSFYSSLQNQQVLTTLETSYTLVAALISNDTPRQINWHLAGARRIGASLEEVRAAREIAMQCSELVGVRWKEGVPEVMDVVVKESKRVREEREEAIPAGVHVQPAI
ncbi:carboxymuconolactone decarboxylase [Moniliophthora roreri MCA 2997]|uniref:Carboxymuconolactone decarboxylase n=2 Tax=Moniliophthora roreri TaxID=221103 RepID=V2WIV0_MONRO|nr:carboxymuconolactone decarboxylase [Moniliophthora roreri MCA 2997]